MVDPVDRLAISLYHSLPTVTHALYDTNLVTVTGLLAAVTLESSHVLQT